MQIAVAYATNACLMFYHGVVCMQGILLYTPPIPSKFADWNHWNILAHALEKTCLHFSPALIFCARWFFFFFSHCIQLCSDHHKEKKYIHMCDVLLGIISDWVLFVYFTFEVAFFALCHINCVTHSDSFLIIHPEVITLQHDVHRVCNQCLFLVKLVFCVKVHFCG